MIRVKICGVTTPDDAVAAAAAGADAIGLNFVSGLRRIEPAPAETILAALPPMCTPVALVDVDGAGILPHYADVLHRYRVSHLQLYGNVTSETLARLVVGGFKPILVHHVRAGDFPERLCDELRQLAGHPPAALLLDAYRPGQLGGTGVAADWNSIAAVVASGQAAGWPPLILAGGLTPENIEEAVRTVRPWGVDVSSGVESAPGRKDPQRMNAFIEAARHAAGQE